jgi:hypothetical protein
MAIEVGRAMKPRANANEPAPVKPFRTVVAIRRAAVWFGVIVSIGACRFNTNTEADLRLRAGCTRRDEECGGRGKRKKHILVHELSSQLLRFLSFSSIFMSIVIQNTYD